MTTLYENYITGDDTFFSIYGADRILAQTFTVATAHTISEVKVKVHRDGTPGTVAVSIRATTGDEPSGGDLASGTFDGDAVGLSASNKEWVTVTLATPLALSAATKYAILMKAPFGTGTIDDINWWVDSTAGTKYANGNTLWSTDNGTSWDAQSDAYDAMFEDRGVSTLPSDAVARVSSIRHIFRPGFFRMQAGLGDLGFDIDVPEVTVRRALDTAKEAAGPGYPEVLETLGMTAEEFAEMGRKLAIGRHLEFPAYEEQIAYEEWFQKQMEELRAMGWEG